MLKQDLINDYVKNFNQIELEGKVFETNEIKTRQSVSLNFKYFREHKIFKTMGDKNFYSKSI